MADPPPYPDTGNDTGVEPDRESTSDTPRWVKVFGVVGLALILLFVILMLIGGHGPGRYTSSRDAGGHTPPSSVTEHGVQQL